MAVAALLTTRDLVKRLQLSQPTIERLVRAGELKTVPIGRALRFDPADVDAFVRGKKILGALRPRRGRKR